MRNLWMTFSTAPAPIACMLIRIQTSGLKRGEQNSQQMSPNAVKKYRENIEEYMVSTEKVVESLDAWQMVGNFRTTGKQGIYRGLI